MASRCLLSSAPCIFSFQNPNWKITHYLGHIVLMTEEEDQKSCWQKLRVLLRASAWIWHTLCPPMFIDQSLWATLKFSWAGTRTPPSEGTIGNEATGRNWSSFSNKREDQILVTISEYNNNDTTYHTLWLHPCHLYPTWRLFPTSIKKDFDIYIPMADSCLCLAVTNKILESNYPSIKK